ncbi:twin-arginine translocase subunit TatC [bacterium]|nr:twin-arginine translocase subunit TatC [bacterium]
MVDLLEQEDIDESGRMTLWEHLDELRKRLVFSLLSLAIGFAVCWFFKEQLWNVVQAPFIQFVPKGDRLSFISLTEPFIVYMKLSALAAVIFTSPILITQLWLFISPGLYRRERRFAIPFILFSTLCFLGGCLFCYYYVFPFACRYFLEVGRNFKQDVRVNDYFSLFSKLTLAIGLIFETPILAFFLARMGIVNHRFLLSKFKYAILLAFVISAIITPTPDFVTQTILAVPMIGLYLVSIIIAWMFGRTRQED